MRLPPLLRRARAAHRARRARRAHRAGSADAGPTRRATVDRRPTFHLGATALLGVALIAAAVAGAGSGPPSAGAAVLHVQGFQATVLGWTSWYGSYGVGDLAPGWCVDHGLRAPDGDLGYVPTSLDGEVDERTQAALAWAATVGNPDDPVDAATTMLVLHDLRGASYPFGTLSVDAMTPANLGGFGGWEATILERARGRRADALAHADVRGPFTLRAEVIVSTTGLPAGGWLAVTLTDASGAPVPDVPLTAMAAGATVGPSHAGISDAGGRALFTFAAPTGAASFDATAEPPDPRPHVWGSTSTPAQRLIRGERLDLRAHAELAPTPTTTVPPTTVPPTTVPPTTTSTTATTIPTTTTTRPVTTTTRPATTTTRRATTTTHPATTTTRPRSTTTSSSSTTVPTTTSSTTTSTTTTSTTTTSTTTTIAPTTLPPSTTSPPMTPSASPAAPLRTSSISGSLPVTGSSSRSLALAGAGLVLLGGSLAASTRPRTRPTRGAGRAAR